VKRGVGYKMEIDETVSSNDIIKYVEDIKWKLIQQFNILYNDILVEAWISSKRIHETLIIKIYYCFQQIT
jgi:hypothetical protein